MTSPPLFFRNCAKHFHYQRVRAGQSIAPYSSLSLQQIHSTFVLVRLHVRRILLLQTDSAPVIQCSLKFLRPLSFILNLVHRTNLLPAWTTVSQSSHVTVWHSLSMSTFHFEKVAYMSFLFLASGANAVSKLDALFILTQFRSQTRGETHTSHLASSC